MTETGTDPAVWAGASTLVFDVPGTACLSAKSSPRVPAAAAAGQGDEAARSLEQAHRLGQRFP
jgi:hypothetical protein